MNNHHKKSLLLLTIGIVLLSLGIYIWFHPLKKTSFICEVKYSEILKDINLEREKRNIVPLESTCETSPSADSRAELLAVNNQWSHEGFTKMFESTDWFKHHENQTVKFSEVLARNFNDNNQIVEAWLQSPAHKEAILNTKYKYFWLGEYKNVVVGWLSD